MPATIPPLVLQPIFKEKIWGGQNLARRLHKDIPENRPIGECWEISGVAGDETTALNAPFAGLSLNTISAQQGRAFSGSTPLSGGDFPLLYKFIDAQDKLSVQVHPDDAQARANGWGSRGKTECWYIVEAAPGAQLICGVNPGVQAADIKRGVEKNTLQEYLNVIDISAGDVVFVPAGTIHAIGAGILLYEVQETSDTTFRLYDYGRSDEKGRPRALHVNESLAVMDCAVHKNYKIAPITVVKTRAMHHRLRVACAYFALEEYEFLEQERLALAPKKSFAVCTVMRGRGTVLHGNAQDQEFGTGQTLLLAAQSISDISFEMNAGSLLAVSWVPDLKPEIIAPLRKSGAVDAAIVQLGGNPLRNALIKLL